MRRYWILWLLAGLCWLAGSYCVLRASQEIQHLQSFRLEAEEGTAQTGKVKFFILRSSTGTISIGGDEDLAIIKSLSRHDKERIVVTIDYPEAR